MPARIQNLGGSGHVTACRTAKMNTFCERHAQVAATDCKATRK